MEQLTQMLKAEGSYGEADADQEDEFGDYMEQALMQEADSMGILD